MNLRRLRTGRWRPAVLLAALLALPATTTAATPVDTRPPAAEPTYTNPVGDDAAPNFADPTVIRGRDGYWYAYATGDPRFAGDYKRKMKIARSKDLVSWEYVGDVFTAETEPRYDGYGDDAVRMYWAPDIEYFDGRYLLYYSYVVNVGNDRHWRAIGVATASSPAGPWTDSGAFVTGPETWEPRPGVQAWRNVIDPEVVATPGGTRYLYYGSVNGGVRVVRLSEDGLTTIGKRTQVTPENRYEAAHAVYRDGFYYLFLSAIGGCCAGPVSAYPVHVARATSPLGPFVDRNGASVLDRNAGGTPVQVPNGNRWVSVGHNTMATDVSGQQWLVTHGIDRYHPYLQGRANARHLVISRLDWIEGWPTTNGGRGLLDGPAPAPATATWIADAFETGTTPGRQWRPDPGWDLRREQAGGYLHNPVAEGTRVLHARTTVRGDIRIRGALRMEGGDGGAAGFVTSDNGEGTAVRTVIDRRSGELVVEARQGGLTTARHSWPLPPTFRYADWHELEVRIRGRNLEAVVSHAGLDDPLVVGELHLPPGLTAGRAGVFSYDTAAAFDDITAAQLFTPSTGKVPDPQVGVLDPEISEEFDDDLSPAWQWLRTPLAEARDGELVLPVQQTELIDQRPVTDDGASVLLREAPAGTWTIETKVTLPFGNGYPDGWPQAGLVALADDDTFVNLGYAARLGSRHVAFGKELPWSDGVGYGDARLGPTADTMWLRLRHHVVPSTGEHHYRAATSADGTTWVWHGVRTLPAGPSPRIGLAAFGIENEDSLSATFDFVRFYRP